MAQGAGSEARQGRLKSWKQIAAFFGTDERTVKRWEASRGLPVWRLPGDTKATVYADVAELEGWLSRRDAAPPAPMAASPPQMRPTTRRLLSGAIGLATVALAGVGLLLWPENPGSAPVSTHQPPQKAVDLYSAGASLTERSTPESLRRAIELYGRAIAEDPAFADAYAALAGTYIRLRQFAAVTEAEAYPRARAAAERALELNPNLSSAHAAMGFISFYADWDFERGLRHFSEAARLDPRSSRGRYQYGMALLHFGDLDAALRELDAAQRLNPGARGILADRGFVLYLLGRRNEGVALISQVAADDPEYVLAQHYLSMIHFGEGDYRAGLARVEIVARLRRDRSRLALVAPARRALEQGGERAMLRVILAGQQRAHAAGREPVYVLAELHALLGDRAEAFRHLRQAVAAREPLALTLRIDPLLKSLHGDPEFQRLAARIGRRAPA